MATTRPFREDAGIVPAAPSAPPPRLRVRPAVRLLASLLGGVGAGALLGTRLRPLTATLLGAACAGAGLTLTRARRAPLRLPPPSPVAGAVSITAQEHHRLIAEAAYRRAERRGFSGGDPVRDWLEAEEELSRTLAGDTEGRPR